MDFRKCLTTLTFFVLLHTCASTVFRIKEKRGTNRFVGNVIKTALPFYLAKSGRSLTSEEIAALRYKFFGQGQGQNHVDYFTINEKSGDIETKKILNRESLCPYVNLCELHLEVAAFSDNFIQIMQISVIVEDVNDHWPEFPQQVFEITIPESAAVNTTFPLPSADDPDAGVNSVQTYIFAHDDPYLGLGVTRNLDNSSDLVISVKKRLDREKTPTHKIEILAVDGGDPKKTGTMTISVTVADINDNRPVFSKTRYNVTVKEDMKVGGTLVTVVATDIDSGHNGRVTYSLSKRTPPLIAEKFQLDPVSGVITLAKNLDYEKDKLYQLRIVASDQGTLTRQTTEALVIINVLDINDNKPSINFNFLSANDAEIPESAKPGKFVAHVSVIDDDSGENSEVRCELTDDTHFRIDTNFQIYLKTKLDRETRDTYDVEVTCRDNGLPELSNSASFVVKVLDDNDNSPKFSRDVYYVSIHENNEIDEVLFKLSATDKDIGDNGRVRYSIEKDTYGLFRIDPTSGVITAKTKLDRETLSSASLVVVAKDQGPNTQTVSAKVEVTILDENDVTPYFDTSKLTFEIPEGTAGNHSLGFVKAYDQDLGTAGKIEYFLKYFDGNRGLFTLSPTTGELRVMKSLDREQGSQYRITLVAKDGGPSPLTGTATITLNVIDKNDNAPVFTFPTKHNNSVVVKTTSKVGHVICVVKAEDKDEGRNAIVSYNVERHSPKSHFIIDSATGVITLQRKLHYASALTITLMVSAQDHGEPKLKSYEVLRINVTYVNTSVLPPPTKPDGPETREEGNNVAIVVTVVVVTLFLVIVLTIVICLVLHQRRRKHPDVEDVDTEMERPSSDPDIVKASTKGSNSFKRGVNGNADFVKGNQPQDDSKPNNGYLNSYDPTNSLTFLWTDSKRESPGPTMSYEARENTSNQPWNEIAQGVPSHRDDASSDVSENSVTSDSGRGGSEEGSARGHISLEDSDTLTLQPIRHMQPNGNYVDMTGAHRRSHRHAMSPTPITDLPVTSLQSMTSPPLMTSSPTSPMTSPLPIGSQIAAVPRHLSGYGRCSSDQNLVLGRLHPGPSDKYTNITLPTRPLLTNDTQYLQRNNDPNCHNNVMRSFKQPGHSNSLDRQTKRGNPHSVIHNQLSPSCHKPDNRNPYTDFSSSSQLANANMNNNNERLYLDNDPGLYPGADVPGGILSKRTHGSMPIRLKEGFTPRFESSLPPTAENRQPRSQKCVRFENFSLPPDNTFVSPLCGSYDDDNTTTTSGSYSLDVDDFCEENVTTV